MNKDIKEDFPEFEKSIDQMPDASKIFVDKSLQIADRVFQLLREKGINQKELAERMGKTEAEVSRMLQGLYNMTLRTISQVEAALQSNVIVIPQEGLTVSDFEEVNEDKKRLVRELDVIINGENAAKQASLCDMVSQVETEFSRLKAENSKMRNALEEILRTNHDNHERVIEKVKSIATEGLKTT